MNILEKQRKRLNCIQMGVQLNRSDWMRCGAELPILADALEEAGCTDSDILQHCRSEGPHARGCWVVDLLLQKE